MFVNVKKIISRSYEGFVTNLIIQLIFLAGGNLHVQPGSQQIDDERLPTLRKYVGGYALSTHDV